MRSAVAACLCLVAIGAQGASLQIEVLPMHGDAPLLLNSLRYRMGSGETASITRLSYLLSDFALERASGDWVDLIGQAAWFDAAKARDRVTLDNIPAGTYRALRFAVGLDPATNRSDPSSYSANHPLNPAVNGLHWSWRTGYIFLAVEGMFTANGKPPLRGLSYHFANGPNRTVVTIPLGLTLAEATGRVGLAFDVAALLNGVSAIRDGESSHSREGDPIAATLKANLGMAFRLRGITDATVAERNTRVRPIDLPARFRPFQFRMGASFPIPDLPRDNPLIEERVALGERLFRELLLSRDGTISCASCHDSRHAFSDPRRFSTGVEGRAGTRHSMPLFNLAWKSAFFWDGRAPSLRAQALMPIQDHVEMDGTLDSVVEKLSASTEYPALFSAAFGTPGITPEKIGLALEQFVLTQTSYDSKFDRAMRGIVKLSAEEQRGFELFVTEYEPRTGNYGADCFHCHGGALFTDHQFHNNGLAVKTGGDVGRYRITGAERDRGSFSTPSLRNVALTAPYMHDGRFSTLAEVVAHYATGIERSPTLDPNLAKHPEAGLPLSTEDQRALVTFLESLTDEKYRSPATAPLLTPKP